MSEVPKTFRQASGGMREFFMAAAVMCIVAIIFLIPALRHVHNWGIQDWDVFIFFHASARTTVMEYGQVPLWNPWFCGGMPLLARPESPWLSPMFVIVLVLGEVVGLKVLVVVHLWIGLLGGYVLGRRAMGLNPPAASLCAMVFMLGGPYSMHLAVGNAWALALAWVPWAVAFWVKAISDFRFPIVECRRPDGGTGGDLKSQISNFRAVVGCAVFLVLMWFGGGPYLLVLTLMFIGLWGVFGVLTRELAWRRVVTALGLIVGLTLALGAIKFVPAIEFTLQYPRLHNLYSGYSVESFLYGLLGRDQGLDAIRQMSQGPGFWRGISQQMNETGSYVGVIPCVLAVVGVLGLLRRQRALVICAGIMIWLSFGVRAPVSLWNVIHKLPVLNIMRVPERFNILLVLCIAILAAQGLAWLMAKLEGMHNRVPRNAELLNAWLPWVVVLVVACDLFLVVRPVWREAFTVTPMEVARVRTDDFRQTAEHYAIGRDGAWAQSGADVTYLAWSSHYPALLGNEGIVAGYEEIPAPQLAVPIEDAGYRGEVFLYGTTGDARYVRWSPNALMVAVAPIGEGYVVINQNFYTGWHVRGSPRRVEKVGGLLGVRVGPEDRVLELFYRPRSFVIGAWISGLAWAGLLGCGVVWRRGWAA